MARAPKPVDITNKHLTKQEIEERRQAEKKLKGNSNLVYKSPKKLSAPEKRFYRFFVDELQTSGILCNLDINILEQTCTAIVKMQECKDFINEHGIVIVKENGDMVKNPACNAYKDYNTIFNKGMQELGLSPSSRSKLAQMNVNAKQEADDPLLKILRGDDG